MIRLSFVRALFLGSLLSAQTIEPVTILPGTTPGFQDISWPAYQGQTYYLEVSPDLINWTVNPSYVIGDDMFHTMSLSGPDLLFFRLFGYHGLPTDDNDGDGLSNHHEITESQTDPENADSDGDGASDGEESASQTDPNDPDSGPAFVVEITMPPITNPLQIFLDETFTYLGDNSALVSPLPGTVIVANPQGPGGWHVELWDTAVTRTALVDFRRFKPSPEPMRFNLLNVREVWINDDVEVDTLTLEIPGDGTQAPTLPALNDPLPTQGGYGSWSLLPVEVEVIHIEVDPATGQPINPGPDTMLRDEIVDLWIKVPTVGGDDWKVDLDIEPAAMKTEQLGTRGNIQMFDFGTIEDDGSVTPLTVDSGGVTVAAPYQITLEDANGGEATIRAVFNEAGTTRIKMKILKEDGTVVGEVLSKDFTINERIRKYANLPSSQNHELDQHDQSILDAAEHWKEVYQHAVDTVDRLKAICMAESELGLTDPNDIMTIGNPSDNVLNTFRNVPPYDQFPTAGKALREIDIANNSTRILSYPNADEQPPSVAILYGTCWLYQKAARIAVNPNYEPNDPAQPYYIPGTWRDWDDATVRYNGVGAGAGVSNYLERIHRSLYEGRHPSNPNLYTWPILTNDVARGN